MTDDEFDKDFEGIFDDASVADFLRPTSARAEVLRANEGAEAFGLFVEEQLRAVRTAWIASETYMQPLAIIANRDKQRIFIPDDDESFEDFFARMHREAVAMNATWTFVAQRTMVAALGDAIEGEDRDVTSPEAEQEAIAKGLLTLGVYWYAERREGRQKQWRHGQMHDENGALGELIEGVRNQASPLFRTILNG